MKFFCCCLLLLSVCFMGCGNKDQAQTNPGQMLGEIWEGFKANNQDIYGKYKDQVFEIPVAILNDCNAGSPMPDSTGKIPVIAITPIESATLSGPQNCLLLLTPQQYSALKVGQNNRSLQWGTISAVAAPSLERDMLVLAIKQDGPLAELNDGPPLWETTAELWRKPMKRYLRTAALASTAYYVDHENKFPAAMEELTEYGFRPWCLVNITFEIVDAGENIIFSAISPEGKYRMSLGADGSDEMKVTEIATNTTL